ncbi:MAG: hypothetical protein APF77_01550 [Clostridia bacterium BRH_c25]|nr:MAG: hypothetical protein APF77_01550 [Clostridia bacterium BRH_c25]
MYKINSESIGDVKKYVWHYRKDNSEHGPFTYEDIIEMVKKGEIGPDDYVLKFGNRKFIKVSEVQGLLDVVEQPAENQDEQAEEPEEQVEMPEEQVAVSNEETKEEFHALFENRVTHIQQKHKKEFSGQKIAVIIAGIVILSLAAWLLTRIL